MKFNLFMNYLTFIFTVFFVQCSFQEESNTYLNQVPPDNSRKKFEVKVDPGYIAAERIAISKDKKEIYYEITKNYETYKIKYYKYYDKKWNGPFDLLNNFYALALSNDDNALYIENNNYQDCWMIKRDGKEWNSPVRFLKNHKVHYLQVTDKGNYYLSSYPENGLGNLDICKLVITKADTSIVGLGYPVNSSYIDGDFYISKDETFMIIMSYRGGLERTDLFVSFNKGNNAWTNPKNMGTEVNTSGDEYGPYVTDDNKYLFYTSGTDMSNTSIYWICIDELLEKLKKSNYAPYVNNKIKDMVYPVGHQFNYQLPDSIFIDDDGINSLTYSATLDNDEPLPTWIKFQEDNKTFSGILSKAGAFNIKITAIDSENERTSCTFSLEVKYTGS